MVANEQLRHSDESTHLIESVGGVASFLRRAFSKPSKSIIAKQGKGITARVIFFVPSTGPESANPRIRKCNTLTGSKPIRQVTDIGQYGQLQIRLRSCHDTCCIGLSTAECKHVDICGESSVVTLNPLSNPENRQW